MKKRKEPETNPPVGWPSLYATDDPVVTYIEICGEVFPFTEKALWRRWERGGFVPTEWAAYFCGLQETA